MDRRAYLRRVGATTSIAIAGFAGCGAPSDGAAETPEPEGTPEGTETATPTATATETEAGNETEAPTETFAGNETATGDGGAGTGAAAAANEVAMLTEGSDYLFNPVGLYVDPGETITWINESGGHSTTAYTEDNPQSDVDRIPNDAEGWNSGILSEQGAEFTHTFEVEGTYDYYCIPHKALGMVARIVVGEPSGLDGDPPDGPVPAEQRIVDEGAVSQAQFDPNG